MKTLLPISPMVMLIATPFSPNQVGNTGMLTGFDQVTNSTARPFSPDPDKYKPATVTGAPAASVDLAVTDPNFKFPQIWRNNIAVDQRLHAELLREAPELAGRGRALLQVHEVGLDPPLGEEPERFPRLAALPDAEDLDFHGAGIYTSSGSPRRRRPLPSCTTF